MGVKICPRCQQRCIFNPQTEDFAHDCNSGNPTLDNEDVVVIGDWTDYTSVKLTKPVAHYKMNDSTSDTVVADSTGVNNGTALRNTDQMTVAGRINNSLNFNGVDDIVNCGSNSILDFGADNFSISAWIKYTDTGLRYAITGKDNDSTFVGWELYIYNPGLVGFWVGGEEGNCINPLSETKIVNDGEWHHLVGIRRGQDADIYIDGVLSATGNASECNGGVVGSVNSSEELVIGFSQQNNEYFPGSIDDVRIYNKELALKEILTIYNNGKGTEDSYPLFTTKVNNTFVQGSENTLFGTRAAIEGENNEDRTRRGLRASTRRQRRHIEFIKLGENC